MADSGSGDPSGQRAPTPGTLVGRRPPGISPGRLPSMRSRDLTLGGVKKVSTVPTYTLAHTQRDSYLMAIFCFDFQKTFTPNIIGRKVKEE